MTITHDQVRGALGNDAAWAELIAPTEQARAVVLILREMRRQSGVIRRRKGAELAAAQAARADGRITQADLHAALDAYATWRRADEGFSRLLTRRMGELSGRMTGHTNMNMRDRAKSAQRVMEALALAIDAHRRGDCNDNALWAELDAVHFDFGRHGRLSLSDALEDGLIRDVDERVYV